MAPPLETRILTHLKSERYRPQPPRRLARELQLEGEENYHAFRNALIPLITLFGLVIPYLLSGSIIVEDIFQWDGIGLLYFNSILSRDYPTVLGLTVITAIVTLVASLIADVLYAFADPRIRFEAMR